MSLLFNRVTKHLVKQAFFGTADEAVIREGCKKLKRVGIAYEQARARDQAARDAHNAVYGDVSYQPRLLHWEERTMTGSSAKKYYRGLIFPEGWKN